MIVASILLIGWAIISCVPVPTEPPPFVAKIDGPGVFVVCEGVWRQDNAVLSYISDEGFVVADVVGSTNPGLRLGDTGSDIHVRGDSMWVVVSTSRSIELFHRRTGRWLGRLRFNDLREPYRMAFVNDSVAVCTFLNDASIAEFDARTLTVRVNRAEVGPAPEGVVVSEGRIYVANSGLGELRRMEQGASTVMVLSTSDLSLLDTIGPLPNVGDVAADHQRRVIWCSYRHYTSQPDSLGGVVAYDPMLRRITRHVRLRSPKALVLDEQTGDPIVLHADGVVRIGRDAISMVLRRPDGETWYGLGRDASSGRMFIGNARSYVTNGEVIVVSRSGEIIARHEVGINPSRMGIAR